MAEFFIAFLVSLLLIGGLVMALAWDEPRPGARTGARCWT